MRIIMFLLLAVGALTGAVAMGLESAQAATVCAAGARGAGCATSRPAVVAPRPVVVAPAPVVVAPPHGAVCRRYGIVGGVRKCVLY
jgi:hypothetical protein